MFSIKKYLNKGLSLMLSASLFSFTVPTNKTEENGLLSNNISLATNSDVQNSNSKLNFCINMYDEANQELMNLDEINEKFKDYGKMTLEGMPKNEYDEAMNIPWRTIEVQGSPENLNINLLETMNYKEIENILYNMAKYEGVSLYDIGDSEQNKNIYEIIIDFKSASNPNQQKVNMLFTGGVHAREFGGTDFSLKMLNDLLIKSQSDPYIKLLLENIRIICVPLVNPDGREMIINGEDESRKANANDVDLNRNMPSLNAGQLVKGIPQHTDKVEKEPSISYFPGYYLGSENESKAMIKFFTTYVSDSNTLLYVDLHQQGEITYYNKNFLSKEIDKLSKSFASNINEFLNNDYPLESESKNYGIDGLGGTMTDFATSIAAGMKFSYEYGRLVMAINEQEQPLICFKDVDKVIEYYRPINRNFRFATIEIGDNSKSLGSSLDAKEARNSAYNDDNWKNFMQNMIEYSLGKELVKSLKNQNSQLSLKELAEIRAQLILYNENKEKQIKLIRNKNSSIL